MIGEGKVNLLIMGGYVLAVDGEGTLGVDGQEVMETSRPDPYSTVTMRANTIESMAFLYNRWHG